MKKLSEEEIILLNCFSYLNIKNQKNHTLRTVVTSILDNPNIFEEMTSQKPASMNQESWKSILVMIQNDEKLCSLKITAQSQIMGYNSRGLNAVCFVDKLNKEAIFVFRGTGRGEWLDNGEAFAETDSKQQQEALEYFQRSVNKSKLVEKGYKVNVTGHSKGGNKAQYITINSDIVNECYSFDGQGFSKEALEKYRDNIHRNKHKIHSINADMDYVHCLGNEIAGDKQLYQSKYTLKFPYHHCPDAILDKNGRLRKSIDREPLQNIMINQYTRYLMELDKETKKEIFTSFMGLAQMYLGKEPAINKKIPSFRTALKAIAKASIEYLKWLHKDRNKFNFKQKVVLAACGLPIFALTNVLYFVKHKFFINRENLMLRTLYKDVHNSFGQSRDGIMLKKVIETFNKDLQKVDQVLAENRGIEDKNNHFSINEGKLNIEQEKKQTRRTMDEIKKDIKQRQNLNCKPQKETIPKSKEYIDH